MAHSFNPLPDVPVEIENAAKSGELVVFVGAGISRLVNCPSWDRFADAVLSQLVPAALDHYELSQILNIGDPKKRLSIAKIVAERSHINIDYAQVLKGSPSAVNVYTHLNQFNCSFITTNYEKYIQPTSRVADSEQDWRFFGRENLLASNVDVNGSVVHLHGCMDDTSSMVITTREYLEHYSSTEVHEFLATVFAKKTVLFLGYGLEETEVLEYILRKSGSGTKEGTIRRFILQGFFNAEIGLAELLGTYYLEAFSTKLIGFPKDYRGFAQQTDILESWSKKLDFAHMALTDEAAALEDEING